MVNTAYTEICLRIRTQPWYYMDMKDKIWFRALRQKYTDPAPDPLHCLVKTSYKIF
jgi:hypothetical protein